MKKIMNRFIDIWKSETPKIWRIIRNISAILGSMAGAVLTAEMSAGIEINGEWKHILAWGIAIGAGVAAFSQLHKDNG